MEPKSEAQKEERPRYNMYRKAALAVVVAWMAKTRSLAPIMLALKVVAAVAFVGAAGAAIGAAAGAHVAASATAARTRPARALRARLRQNRGAPTRCAPWAAKHGVWPRPAL